ncbi:MAG: C39 family peptidase [Synergistaceae bacterium]|nr:C39 family peptidase [Synergistaceae bacterium]
MKKNRHVVVAMTILFALFLSFPACGEIQQFGPNFFNAGVYTVNFSTARQKGDFWCWAACIEMVLRYHGMDITQEQMVQKIHGSLIDKVGQPMEILEALTGTGPNAYGGTSLAFAEGYNGLYPYFIHDLINGYPLIVGLNYGTEIGHAVVLTAVAFQTDAFGQFYPMSVVIRDPWPDNAERQEIPFEQFMSGCFFSARVSTVPY